jgi:acyl-coenzyme A thioesterase PaaI-like protein
MATPEFLKTHRKENFNTWKFRTLMNWYPMYFGTGGKILFWSADNMELHLRIRLNAWTYNYVGTIFGGSMFSATDPFYMLILMKKLGNDFVVWDKAANIRFKKPAKNTLYAKYLVSEELLTIIRNEIESQGETTKTMTIELKDSDEKIHAVIEREIYIANKKYYQTKKGQSQQSKLGI